MGRYAKEDSNSSFAQAPAGTHVARCIRIIDIGTQPAGEWQGKITPARNQVIVMWELPGEMMDADDQGNCKPYIVSRFYTNSLYEKSALYGDLVSWRGRDFTPDEKAGFDLQNILNAPCLVTVTHNEAGKAKVTGVAKLVKGMDCPPAYNDVWSFWIEEWDEARFSAMSDGIKKLITGSAEFKAMATGAKPAAQQSDADDSIPF